MKATWKKGYRSKIDADVAFDELEKIKESNSGVLTAGIVLIKAKKKLNKLHGVFEWDDSIAAEEHRLEQARSMLRSIEVVYKESPKQSPHRYYMTVTEAPKQDAPSRKVYRTTKEILEDPDCRDELLGNAIREALSYRRKYHELSELANVFFALDEFISNAKVV